MKSDLAIIASKKTGFFKRESCVVSFFDDEILITIISKEKMKELYDNMKQETKDAGGGFFRQMVNAGKALPEYLNKIESMTKEEIKKENTEVINKTDITKIKFTKASDMVDYDSGTTNHSEGKLILILKDKKIKFYHNYSDNNRKKFIKEYLG